MKYLDPLYGEIELEGALGDLVWLPPVQRMRHIRLSNIDSIDMPGVANISRYEHVLGACYLASQISLPPPFSVEDVLVLRSAALLHDCMISPFGHLVEEAFAYASLEYHHEEKLKRVLGGQDLDEVGGAEQQVLFGRVAGLGTWARRAFGTKAKRCLSEISETIQGLGHWGGLVSGPIDVDNLDNVCRVAFHMGLKFDLAIPTTVARGIHVSPSGEIAYSDRAIGDVETWLELRRRVYERFMLSRNDFAGKLMIIWSVLRGIEEGFVTAQDWNNTDLTMSGVLAGCDSKDVRETFERWSVGDLWKVSDLVWFDSRVPGYTAVYEFGKQLSLALKKPCFAYRIKDKRVRKITLNRQAGGMVSLGKSPSRWLLGIGTSKRDDFSRAENKLVVEMASEFFSATPCGGGDSDEPTMSLF